MSPVVIILMLIDSAASAANIISATPVCVRMPVPTIDTLLTSSAGRIVAPSSSANGFNVASVRFRSLRRDGEADGRLAAGTGVLDDHVDGDVLFGDGREDAAAGARPVGDAVEENADLVLRQGGPADDNLLSSIGFGDDPGPLGVAERRCAPSAGHRISWRTRSKRRVHDARAHAGQFEHFVVADGVHFAGLGHERAGRWCRCRRRRCRFRTRHFGRRLSTTWSGPPSGRRPGPRPSCPSRPGRAW